jgi:16S rRNA (guanine966-N2)-methyltransferase
LRIISGQLKGRRLQSISGMQVRPTADHVREALFNILANDPLETSVLDLFSGTGALGIEALSRGAKNAVFIDKDSQPLTVLHKNLLTFGLLAKSQIIRWDIARNLNCLKAFHNQFDLVFLDPPYHKCLVSLTLSHLLQVRCLAPSATIIAEHERGADVTSPDSSIVLKDQRRYGQTELTFFKVNPNSVDGTQ